MPNRYKKMSHRYQEEYVDVAIVGAGAAGLFAAIWAGRNSEGHPIQIAVFDSAKKLGAKILVAGGISESMVLSMEAMLQCGLLLLIYPTRQADDS